MDKKEELKSIEKFIYNDKVQKILSEINDNVMDFNILEITGMGNQEIKHSNILGWLFDDSEHNLEYQILDNFLKKVIKNNNSINNKDKLQEYLYLSNKKRDITIYREKDNIDLLIVDESNKIVITIENKVHANERTDGDDGGQLQKYEDIINERYNKNYQKYFIFLTIDLEEPSKDNWLIANHKMTTDIIKNILKTKETTAKTKIVLESYVDLLKRNGIVPDTKLEQLCEKIWHNKEYSKALDILVENKRTPIEAIFHKLREEYEIEGRYVFIELEGIKKLYSKFEKVWEEPEQIFEIQLIYKRGKDESIRLRYCYSDLKSQNNEKLKNICNTIMRKTNTPTKAQEQETATILKINKEYIGEKDIDTVVSKVIDKINEIDKNIIAILNENNS